LPLLFGKNRRQINVLGITDDLEDRAAGKKKPFCPELFAFEKYLKNEKFIPYLQLAVRMKDSNIDIKQFETLINKLIKQTKNKNTFEN
jgi:hypothetical protein